MGKWNSKNSWKNYRTATNATIRSATSADKARDKNGSGGKSKGIGGGSGGMDALTAVNNIVRAHGTDVAEYVRGYYTKDDLVDMAVERLGLEGIPWDNTIYDKDHDGIDFKEEVYSLVELLPEIIANEWLSGAVYMPSEFCDYCFYDVSSHNSR